jgi:hypothetical protein
MDKADHTFSGASSWRRSVLSLARPTVYGGIMQKAAVEIEAV